MRSFLKVAVGVLALSAAGTANATVYVLDASGTVSSVTLAKNGVFTPLTGGKINVGDAFRLQTTFDTGTAELTSLFDADPTVNIYYLPNTTVSLAVGSYNSNIVPRFDISSTAQLWNDRPSSATANDKTDSQSFEFSNYDFKGNTPFDLDGRFNFEDVELQSFDFSGLARKSDLISEIITSESAFNSNSLSYGYLTGASALDNTTQQQALVSAGNVKWTLTAVSAVPEPASWATLIVGMGLVGGLLRRKPKVRTAGAISPLC